jgi:D-alanyl-D-alanine carboxypeptidase/D-alanyl-D-alanine-endopeptidase (penicillin-binding protein 4)
MSQVRLRVLLATLALLLAGASPASGSSDVLRVELARALAGAGLSPARTSALAVDLRSGETVFARNARLALAPASNEKLAVAYASLVELGPGYRFRTQVAADGELAGRTWRGNLYLVGFGDPTLSGAGLDALAAQVRAWGIRRVTGRVVGDESWFDPRRDAPGWKPGWVGDESPPLSALVVDRADGWPRVAPALEAAARLTRALARRGVAVTGDPAVGRAPEHAFPLAEHLSAELAEIVRSLNRDSDNFAAELLLKQLGASAGAGGTTAAGARVVRRALSEAGAPLAGVRIVDGSGLSSLDRLSAAAIVALLRAADHDPTIRDAFVGSLAVAGVSGTLQGRLDRRPTYGRVIAKTGTTNLASSLSGFVRGRYAFAILHAGNPVSTWTARAAQDRFVTLLARAG